MKSHLKVKVHSLTHEMTYIRRQEEKWKNRARWARQRQKENATEKGASSIAYAENNFWSLRAHRVFQKPEVRATHLAHGFMKGQPYAKMEHICYGQVKGSGSSEPDWKRIETMVARFAADDSYPQDTMQRYAEWLAEAKVWYESNIERILNAKMNRDDERIRRANDPVYQAEKLARHMKARHEGLKAAGQ